MLLLTTAGDVWLGGLMTLANIGLGIMLVAGVRLILRDQPE